MPRRAAAVAGLSRPGAVLYAPHPMTDDNPPNPALLPFEPLVPNAETIEAMKAARRGDLVTDGKPDALLASLNADS
jgi:hypothetical protein